MHTISRAHTDVKGPQGTATLPRLEQQLVLALQHQPFMRKHGDLDKRHGRLLALIPPLAAALRADGVDEENAFSGALACHPVMIAWADSTFFPEKLVASRADLATLNAWKGLDTDTSGNPSVWENSYRDESGKEWTDHWSCQCDDEGVSPHESRWIGPEDEEERSLWEALDDAG